MNLFEMIKADRMIAYKAKENIKKDVLGCLIGDATKDTKEPDNVKVLATIKKFIDGANEVIKYAEKGSFEEYKAQEEIKILSAYRPPQLSETDIKIIAENFIAGKLDIYSNLVGNLQSFFKQNYSGQYDGALVSKVAKELGKK